MCENLHALKLIGKRLSGAPVTNGDRVLEHCIDQKIATEMPDDDVVSEHFVPKLIKMIKRYGSMDGVTNEEKQELEDLYLKAFYCKNWANSWLKLFSVYIEKRKLEDVLRVCFSIAPNEGSFEVDNRLSRFMTKYLTRKFSGGLLFKFVMEFLPHLVKKEAGYPKSFKALTEHLLTHLDIMEDTKQTIHLFRTYFVVQTKADDNVMECFMDIVNNEARKCESKSRDLIYMVNLFTSYVFEIRQHYPKSYEKAKHAIVHVHNYDKVSITKSINQCKIFRKSSRGILLRDVSKLIPSRTPLSKRKDWLKISKLPSLIMIINTILDYILDIFLTIDYWFWKSYVALYQCSFAVEQSNASIFSMATCFPDKSTSTCFNCTFTFNGSITEGGLNSSCHYDGDQSQRGYALTDMLNSSTGSNSVGCSIHAMNEHLAFGISASVLSLTHILHFFIVALNWKSLQFLLSYIYGDCCMNKYNDDKLVNKKRRCRSFILGLITVVLCILLPFVTKLFVVVIMGIQLHQIECNEKIFQELGIKSKDYRECTKKPCKHCKGCSNKQKHICVFCGSLKGVPETSPYYDIHFTQQVEAVRMNLLHLNRLDRLVTGALENSYCPLVQVSLVLPLLRNSPSAQTSMGLALDGSDTFGDVAYNFTYWAKLILTGFSIAASLIGLSSTATQLHFSRNKKSSFKPQKSLKITFQAGTMFQICGRLLMLVGFGYVIFQDNVWVTLFVAAILFCHCLLLFVVKTCMLNCLPKKWGYELSRRKQNALLSSFLSTYVYVEWEGSEKDGKEDFKHPFLKQYDYTPVPSSFKNLEPEYRKGIVIRVMDFYLHSNKI